MRQYRDILLNSQTFPHGMEWEDAKKLENESQEYRLPTLDELKIISASGKRRLYSGDVLAMKFPWFWTSEKDEFLNFAYAVNFYDGSVMPICNSNPCNVRLIKGTKEDVINWCFDFHEAQAIEAQAIDEQLVTVSIINDQKEIANATLEKEAFLNLYAGIYRAL